MSNPRPKQPPVLERRRRKRAVAAAARLRNEQRDRAKALRDLAKRHLLVNPANLGPNTSYDCPDFVSRGYYVDKPFRCKACSVEQVWTEAQQKWWYESAKGNVWAVAVLCRPCRRRERQRRKASRNALASGDAEGSKNAA